MNLEYVDCNISASIGGTRKTIGGTVSGKAYFIYTDPYVNITVRTTEPFSAKYVFFL